MPRKLNAVRNANGTFAKAYLIKHAANMQLPIQAIPAEVVSRIALHHLHDDSDGTTTPLVRMMRLTHVYWRWRVIVQSDQNLWEQVDSRDRRSFLGLRSLHPGIVLTIRSTETRSEALTQFLATIREEAHRWVTLQLLGNSNVNSDGIAALTVTAPHLTTLRVASRGIDADQYLLEIVAPSLRHVDVRGIQLKWGELSRLISLHIAHLETHAPSIRQLYAILEASFWLEWFELREVQLTGMDDEEFINTALPLSLPKLRGCKLILTTIDIINHYHILASFIIAPACHILHIDGSISPAITAMDLIRGPEPPITTITRLPMQSPTASVHVHYEAGALSVVVGGKPLPEELRMSDERVPYVNLSINFPWSVEQWPSFASTLSIPSSSPAGGTITFNPSQNKLGSTADQFLDQHLGFWSSSKHISFKSGFRFVKKALRYLANPKEDAEGTLQWACPALSSLVFDYKVQDDCEMSNIRTGTLLVLQARNSGDLDPQRQPQTRPARIMEVYGSPEFLLSLRRSFTRQDTDYGVRLVPLVRA